MKIITIKLRNQNEWQFLLDLLRRLNINFEWREEKKGSGKAPPPNTDAISALFGSWPSDKSSDEVIESILDARVSQTREIHL